MNTNDAKSLSAFIGKSSTTSKAVWVGSGHRVCALSIPSSGFTQGQITFQAANESKDTASGSLVWTTVKAPSGTSVSVTSGTASSRYWFDRDTFRSAKWMRLVVPSQAAGVTLTLYGEPR